MKKLWDKDNPWHRLPWTLPAALLIWALAIFGIADFMGKPANRPMGQPAIDAQLIEQSTPAPTRIIQKERPAVVHRAKPRAPARPKKAPLMPRKVEKKTNTPVKELSATAPIDGQAPAAANTAAKGGTETGSHDSKGASANNGARTGSYGRGSPMGNIYGSSGAQAIVRPMPQIPNDLREEAFNFAALARFHIAVDGSVKVELTRPTPNPRLNRILLDSLKKWRFIPAIKNGKPVASTEEIVVKIEVK